MEDGESSASQKRCESEEALELDARGVTGRDGAAKILLSNYICGYRDARVRGPVTLLATPDSGHRPVFITCSIEITPNADDVTAVVYSWEPGGERTGNVSFSWRMRLRYERGPIVID